MFIPGGSIEIDEVPDSLTAGGFLEESNYLGFDDLTVSVLDSDCREIFYQDRSHSS